MRQSNAPTPWYWFVISGIFLIISIGFVIWSTNQEWEFSHDCQCGTPYGTSQGDYVTSHTLAQVIPSVLVVVGLLIHPIAGIVVSGVIVGVNVIHLGQVMSNPEPGLYTSFMRGHAVFLLLLGCVGIVISVIKLIEPQIRASRNRSSQ